eukprot:scaffold798_cov268-Chaetoceros_neogracile.AAC.32
MSELAWSVVGGWRLEFRACTAVSSSENVMTMIFGNLPAAGVSDRRPMTKWQKKTMADYGTIREFRMAFYYTRSAM